MSNPAGNGRPEQEALTALESAVGHVLDRLARVTERLHAAEAKGEELGEVVKKFSGDQAEADRVFTRLRELEEENADLKETGFRRSTGI